MKIDGQIIHKIILITIAIVILFFFIINPTLVLAPDRGIEKPENDACETMNRAIASQYNDCMRRGPPPGCTNDCRDRGFCFTEDECNSKRDECLAICPPEDQYCESNCNIVWEGCMDTRTGSPACDECIESCGTAHCRQSIQLLCQLARDIGCSPSGDYC